MDFSIISDNIGLYFSGLVITIELVVTALVLGLIIAVPLALMSTSRNPFIWGPVWLFIYVFRGTPLLVQLYVIYYGFGQFAAVRESF
ncbi:MAG: ABC transporter permease subunit, partial [Acidiferrobacterales bacterium]